MQIVMLSKPEGNVVARETQAGKSEGEFYRTGEGEVWYRSPLDSNRWYVNPSVETFRRAVLA